MIKATSPPLPPSLPFFNRLHFQWWVPADRVSFLKPWGNSGLSGGYQQGSSGARGGGDYAPPRPMSMSMSPRLDETLGGGGARVNGSEPGGDDLTFLDGNQGGYDMDDGTLLGNSV